MKIKNLADLAGVSPSTVSKAFSGSHEVSEATRDRIFALAREHGVFEKYDKHRFCKRVIAVHYPRVKLLNPLDICNTAHILLGSPNLVCNFISDVSVFF